MLWTWLLLLCLGEHFDLEPDSAETRRWVAYLDDVRYHQTHTALLNAIEHLPRLRAIFNEEGIPEDLVWMALIESGFRHDATSPTGAQGMFQFKVLTARAFGLSVSPKEDDRDDPYLAARAAAKYLAYLRAKFDSWELVLAAYNLGEGDLRRTMQARKAKTWREVKPFVRPETRAYVGKVKAAAVIGNDFLKSEMPQKYREITIYQVKK